MRGKVPLSEGAAANGRKGFLSLARASSEGEVFGTAGSSEFKFAKCRCQSRASRSWHTRAGSRDKARWLGWQEAQLSERYYQYQNALDLVSCSCWSKGLTLLTQAGRVRQSVQGKAAGPRLCGILISDPDSLTLFLTTSCSAFALLSVSAWMATISTAASPARTNVTPQ